MVLLVLIILMLGVVCTVRYWYPAPIYEVKMEQFFLESTNEPFKDGSAQRFEPPDKVINDSPFDPNEASESELESHGIPGFLSGRIIKYRNAGGIFRQKTDLLKIYDFPEALYAQLEHKIELPQKKAPIASTGQVTEYSGKNEDDNQRLDYVSKTAILPIDINSNDTLAWQALKGIGPVLSARIIKYKAVLGGFTDLEQLQEVFGLPEEVLEENSMYLMTDPEFEPRRISISESDTKQLAAHPYISYSLAKILKAYEQQHAPLDSLGQLRNIEIMDDEKYSKIAPYLCL